MIADQWYTKATFIDGDALLFDLGSDAEAAREFFIETRRQFEKAKNNPAVHKHVYLGSGGWYAANILHLELIEPGTETDGDVAD